MQTPQTENRMTQDPQRTKMVQPPKKAYIRAIRPIRLGKGPDYTHIRENQVAVVTEGQAREFADKKFTNAYPYSGERQSHVEDAQPGTIVRAVRITEAEYREALKAQKGAEDEEETEVSA